MARVNNSKIANLLSMAVIHSIAMMMMMVMIDLMDEYLMQQLNSGQKLSVCLCVGVCGVWME